MLSKKNPADEASKGIIFINFAKVSRWLQGPELLLKQQSSWRQVQFQYQYNQKILNWKKQVRINKISFKDELLGSIEENEEKGFFLTEDETNNSIGVEMKNQHCTEKRNDASKIKIVIRFF